MAPPAGQIRPGRYLAFFVLIVVVLYGLVFLTGDRKPVPKLGIDLQGGTRVTLTARTPDGKEPSKESLDQARKIIEGRVNGIGVQGTQVVLDGSNLVITVPGEQGDQAKNLGKTAKLGFRKVLNAAPITPPAPPPGQAPPGQAPPSAPQQPGQAPPAPQGGGGGSPGSGPLHQQQPPPAPAPTPSGDTDAQAAAQIKAAKDARQNPALGVDPKQDPNVQQAQDAALAGLKCGGDDPLRGNDDPNLPLVTCGTNGDNYKYVLAPVFLPGEQVDTASATPPQQGSPGWTVALSFKSEGAKIWADFTSKNVQEQAAFVLDSEVVSAPTIQQALLDGKATISGQFNQKTATELADVLKYGSLPLSFASSDATTVSATLGLASLEAGLIAGGVGLLLVFIYCLFYYRLLGVLTVLSLALSGALVYSVLVLLGRGIGYTLDLAGVAGLIIAIGMTADSFVIFFERLKDEMREGRSFRSAVPRGWTRARRTILASDAVTFLGAAVLYLLAVGEVKGFAFTLGMSTLLDLVVVWFVTHPLVAMISKSKTLSKPGLTGLGGVQRVGAQRRRATQHAGAAAKEA